MILPDSLPAIQALVKSASVGVPPKLLQLVHLRAGQINGCSVCVDMHARSLHKYDETVERTLLVAAWRDTPVFTEAERAALALTEAITRIGDRTDPVPDDVWNEAARHFDEAALAAIVVNVALANFFNRINIATKQIAGTHKW
jgi:AhpD family alkylhydroperoxidase